VPSNAGLQWGAFFGDVEHEVQHVRQYSAAGEALQCSRCGITVQQVRQYSAAGEAVQCSR
jgi:hypothetical protein